MTPTEYVLADGVGLAGLVRAGKVEPAEIVEAAIGRIEALNGSLNAVTETAFALAREAAARVDRTAPLAGVPFLAKDMNIDVRGLRLTASCRWLKDLPPATDDAPLARRWRAAGLIILGRTNLPEWAEDFLTEPTWRGPTANPWDRTRSPGGSSGGAAAAVASGMVPIAHGTDSGGSIRVPAAACGLVGFKPSRGLVPVGPHHDELAGGLDCEHVLTRTVRDTALMLDVTAGPEATTRTPFSMRTHRYIDALEAPPPRLRIGIAMRPPGNIQPDDEIGAAVEAVAALLGRHQHVVRPFEFPEETDIGDAAAIAWMTSIAEEIDHYTERVGRPPADHELEAATHEIVRRGRAWTAVDYVRSRRVLTRATRSLVEAMEDVDLLITPCTATLPPATGTIDGRTDKSRFDAWVDAIYRYAPYTEICNVTGQPALSLPLAQSRSGLPIGVQLIGRLGADEGLLGVARWLERELPWAERTNSLLRRYLDTDHR